MAGGRFIYRLLVSGNGERDRIRTCDPVIKSHLLYQLSYAPVLKRTWVRKKGKWLKVSASHLPFTYRKPESL